MPWRETRPDRNAAPRSRSSPPRGRRHPPKQDFCAEINAMLYVLKTGGCQWRMLPKEFPPWKTV
ncbi:MAG: transposase [Azoarcus sp.]|nr:transposase [Azoarcus sp.]